jgi:hypothetical protein
MVALKTNVWYAYSIMTETKSHLDQLLQEQTAVALMRDDISFLIGWTRADNPEIAQRLEDILANHTKNRNK